MNMAKTPEQKTETPAVSVPEVVAAPIAVPEVQGLQPDSAPVVVAPVEQSQPVDVQLDVAPALQQELNAPQPQEQQRVGFKRKSATQTIPAALSKSATLKEVEDLLTEDLTDIYQSMTPQEQIAFRQKGEEVAHSIEKLVVTFRATTRKVLDLIRSWLAMIPRVNRYFLEQESKIKTDEIMKLQKKVKKEAKKRVDVV
jgi:hypothetical protein